MIGISLVAGTPLMRRATSYPSMSGSWISKRMRSNRSDRDNGHRGRMCVERLIGTIRRECINHVLVFGETHLHRLLTAFMTYFSEARTHSSPRQRRIELSSDSDGSSQSPRSEARIIDTTGYSFWWDGRLHRAG
jgi:hypothetical protein